MHYGFVCMRTILLETSKPLTYATRVVWFVASLVETLLIIRLLLKLFGANTDAPFTQLVYVLSNPLITPFSRVFSDNLIQSSIIEWTTVLALFVYWAIAFSVSKLLHLARGTSRVEAARALSKRNDSPYKSWSIEDNV